MSIRILLFFFLASLLFSCVDTNTNSNQAKPPFQLLRKEATGLNFENELRQSSEFNVFNYMYFFNGGGLSAGDFNNDGLVDLYFTSNMGENKLFLNQGGLKFKDVTTKAGVAGMNGWTSGTSVVDINNDGMLDIYVCQMGDYQTIKGRNQLYVCDRIEEGIPIYEEQAAYYQLDFAGFATQAAFFDYDLDGDLDAYLLNHSLHANGTFGQKKTFINTVHPTSGDKLLRNDQGKFVDVTHASNIKSTVIGYGLGIATGDLNLDGWPDIYIGNDFHENDYLYINQQDGTFKEVLTEQIMHTSRFSMGVDLADINNDGWSEIISLDMMPENPFILKTSLGEDPIGTFNFKLGYGYNHQYARNNLQLNNGNGTFSEVGMFAGIHATDWSWAPLFFDFDHDGNKDLFISNGIPRRMNDIDYVNFRETSELRWKQNTENLEEEDLVVVDKMPQIKLPNKFYKNSSGYHFEDLSGQIKDGTNTFSNGAVYADLDNDGDLDVVVNNHEEEPFLYQNLTMENGDSSGNYLALKLKGAPQNIHGIGARAVVFKGTERLIYEHFPVRGYQSSMPFGLHLGLGEVVEIDSVLLIWSDHRYQKLTDFQYNTTLEVAWKTGLPKFNFEILRKRDTPKFEFEDITNTLELDFVHKENPFVEFNRERLIPYEVSSESPALAVGDVNGDGLEDVFFGSSKRKRSALFLQTQEGLFVENTPKSIINDSIFEDVDVVFVDVENDGDLDLIIAAGGNEFKGEQEAMTQRLYENDGQGNFERKDVFPGAYLTASCVLPADFNGDGLVDFFFGGRAVPWNYGYTPTSYLFENQGNGKFIEVTQKYAEGLHDVGLVKNGAWEDVDGDGDQDLVLAVEWEAIQIFLNEGNQFKKQSINDLKGWWNFALPYDFDGDGDVDILAGNTGTNTKFQATKKEPVKMYVNDFDDNDQIEQILTYYLKGQEVPFANYSEITSQLVHLKKKYLLAKDFANAGLADIFGKEKLEDAVYREVNTLESMYFENMGNLTFKAHPLPSELQFSTIQTGLLYETYKNGETAVLLGGNFYDGNVEMGRYDANFGNVLTIASEGKMTIHPLGNITIKGQIKRIESVTVAGAKCFIFARNNDSAKVLRTSKE